MTRWHTFWRRLTAAYLIGFLAPEIYGLVTVGSDASWSGWYWHSTGAVEECEHTRSRRAGFAVFCVWLWAHLSYGKFGVGGRRPHVALNGRRVPDAAYFNVRSSQ